MVPAEGVILERVLDATHSISPEGLSHDAYAELTLPTRRPRGVAITDDDLRWWMVPTCLRAPRNTTLRRFALFLRALASAGDQ